ncbi:MAG: CHAD domain-containing protein [Acidimicrobiia bacterium]|nr:CHAD domain-containing protein [Acidimicrobiia bacterium]
MKSLAATEVAHLQHLTARLADPTDLDVAIHATRTGIKRLRAFLRLARQSIGTSTYRAENSALGHTARLLAPARDAYVLIETAGELGATDRILVNLSEDHTRAIAVLEAGPRTEAVHRLEAMIGRWRLLEWHGPESLSIGAGLVRTYGRGLADFETVRTVPAATAFHSWRRRVKYLRYQLEALDAPDRVLGPYTLLGDDLGFEHDQTVLLGVCDLHADDETFASLAHRSLERREELRVSAINRGMPLFDQEPDSFRRTIEEMIGLH